MRRVNLADMAEKLIASPLLDLPPLPVLQYPLP